jgi:hypothetical protein
MVKMGLLLKKMQKQMQKKQEIEHHEEMKMKIGGKKDGGLVKQGKPKLAKKGWR